MSPPQPRTRQGNSSSYPRIAIVGAGMSGLCMAIKLAKAGFTAFTIFEKAGGIGGTWWDNTYPGAQCDVRSHLYSYSFDINPEWDSMFAAQAEIQRYMQQCAEKHGLLPHIRLNTEIIDACFDTDQGLWRIRTAQGDTIDAEIFICSAAPLHQPRYPDIPGLTAFQGHAFHSSRWDHSYDFSGKKVAVIGNAASAVQFIPHIARQAQHLFVFQRSPQWILPRSNHRYTHWQKTLFRLTPIARAYRYGLYWLHESYRLGFTQGSIAAKLATKAAEKHLHHQIPDSALRALLRPTYPMGCKRVLISNDYYPTLMRPNVELVTSSIERFTSNGITTVDGKERSVDIIIFATGFESTQMLSSVRITGLAGATLATAWQTSPQAYRGVTVSEFPNFFLLLGPNTGQGHTSTLIFIEAQADYAIRCIRELMQRRQRYMAIKPEAMADYNIQLQQRLQRSVWAGECRSWYKTDTGKIVAIYPGFSFTYLQELRRPRFNDYLFI